MLDENDLQKLLRLKRYEQPPPDYFEDFLHEFHRRQRAELLREPLWKIARDRITAFFTELTAPRLGYAGGVAAVLAIASIISVRILQSPGEVVIAQAPVQSSLSLDARAGLPHLDEFRRESAQSVVASFRPRYVMDTHPVSYEPSSSF